MRARGPSGGLVGSLFGFGAGGVKGGRGWADLIVLQAVSGRGRPAAPVGEVGMRDVLYAIGMLAVFVGILLLPMDIRVGSGLTWQGILALLVAAIVPRRDEKYGFDD